MALSQLYLQQRQLYNILSEVKCIMHVKSNGLDISRRPFNGRPGSLSQCHLGSHTVL